MIGNDLRTLKSKICNHAQLDKPIEPLPTTPPPQPFSDANSSKHRLSLHSTIINHSSDDEKVSASKVANQKRSDEIHHSPESR